MTSKEIRDKYIKFFTDKKHKQISPSKLVPDIDSSSLFVSSGMQPLIPYLLGQEHPEGKRLVNSQPSFRAEDIEEVGDNRHTTFFEMLGNWSLGEYFKKEQLEWIWEFLTIELNLPKEKLYVSIFEGNDSVPEDKESYEIWKSLGIEDNHIYKYGVEKNWWSRSGAPEKMPVLEIGGPDSEVFYEFTSVVHDKKFGEKCHPNCDCGRFLEIGNSVFIQYQKIDDGSLKELVQKNVDFGGGLERLVAVKLNESDIFKTDLFAAIIEKICKELGVDYEQHKQSIQTIADHIKASVFLIKEGVVPSNKLAGYTLRRLLRRAAIKAFQINKEFGRKSFKSLVESIANIYPLYFDGVNLEDIEKAISDEIGKFRNTLEEGLKEEQKIEPQLKNEQLATVLIDKNLEQFKISHKEFVNSFGNTPNSLGSIAAGTVAFNFQSTYGLPAEEFKSIIVENNVVPNFQPEEFDKSLNSIYTLHQDLSRTASAGMFKGGLADHSEIVTKYHTATHLLHQCLRDVLGDTVFQKGSNITSERLRFDFSYDKKMTDEEIKQTEELLNKKIEEDSKVDRMIVSLKEAKEMNAIGLFDEKYADKVSLYGIGPNYKLDENSKDKRERGGYYSLEFCGGPHIEHTGVIGKVRILKEEAISAGIRRVRVVLA